MLKAVIVDDNDDAISSINLIVNNYCKKVSIVGQADSILEGIKEIDNKKPDLVFLDIEMPGGTGFNILEKVIYKDFEIIFVSAHGHYALRAIKYSAIDYVVKPIDIDELIVAIEKVRKIRNNDNYSGSRHNILFNNLKETTPHTVVIISSDSLEYVDSDDIIYIKAAGSYSVVYIRNEQIMSSKSIGAYEDMLADKDFLRIHRSYIINLKYVKKFIRNDGGYIEMKSGCKLAISRRRKPEFIKIMNKFIIQ